MKQIILIEDMRIAAVVHVLKSCLRAAFPFQERLTRLSHLKAKVWRRRRRIRFAFNAATAKTA
jgi:hypothetical protein